jgi:hypothetical protein
MAQQQADRHRDRERKCRPDRGRQAQPGIRVPPPQREVSQARKRHDDPGGARKRSSFSTHPFPRERCDHEARQQRQHPHDTAKQHAHVDGGDNGVAKADDQAGHSAAEPDRGGRSQEEACQ